MAVGPISSGNNDIIFTREQYKAEDGTTKSRYKAPDTSSMEGLLKYRGAMEDHAKRTLETEGKDVMDSFKGVDIDGSGNIDYKEMTAFMAFVDDYDGKMDGKTPMENYGTLKNALQTDDPKQKATITDNLKNWFRGLYSDTAKERGI